MFNVVIGPIFTYKPWLGYYSLRVHQLSTWASLGQPKGVLVEVWSMSDHHLPSSWLILPGPRLPDANSIILIIMWINI